MPRLKNYIFTGNSDKSFFRKKLFGYFYHLDCISGEGLVNLLLVALKEISPAEFNYYLNFFLKKCINVNRSFSDAVDFLSIWLEKSPDTLFKKFENVILINELTKELIKENELKDEIRINELKNKLIKKLENELQIGLQKELQNELKIELQRPVKNEIRIKGLKKELEGEIQVNKLINKLEKINLTKKSEIDNLINELERTNLKFFFNRTEYSQDGANWRFPDLLEAFSSLVKKKLTTADEILFYLFETFDFSSIPDVFIREVIGYDQLQERIEKTTSVFQQALLSKINKFVAQNNTIDIGLHSRKYLQDKFKISQGEIKKVEKSEQEKRQVLSYALHNRFFSYSTVSSEKEKYHSYILPTSTTCKNGYV